MYIGFKEIKESEMICWQWRKCSVGPKQDSREAERMQVEEIKDFSASCIPDSLNLENSNNIGSARILIFPASNKDKRSENSHNKQLASHILGSGQRPRWVMVVAVQRGPLFLGK
jgi:hypothetical protein